MARFELEMVPKQAARAPSIQFRAQGEARVPNLTSTRELAVREFSIRSWGTLGCPREIGLGADVPADGTATEGVIAALEEHDLTGRRVGVRLYPGIANERQVRRRLSTQVLLLFSAGA